MCVVCLPLVRRRSFNYLKNLPYLLIPAAHPLRYKLFFRIATFRPSRLIRTENAEQVRDLSVHFVAGFHGLPDFVFEDCAVFAQQT